MAHMKSTLVYVLFWINLLVISLDLFLYRQAIQVNNHIKNKIPSNLQNGTKNILEKDKTENNIEKSKQTKKFSITIETIILILYITAITFLGLLLISFWVTNNECCRSSQRINSEFPIGSCFGTCTCCNNWGLDEDTDLRWCYNCNYDFRGETDIFGVIIGIIILTIIYIILIIIASILKTLIYWGKYIIRIISLISLILIEITISALSFCSGNNNYLFLITLSFSICALCNFLGLIVPILQDCIIQYYENYKRNQINNSDETIRLLNNQESRPFIEPLINDNNQEVIQVQPNPPIIDYFGELNKRYKGDSEVI